MSQASGEVAVVGVTKRFGETTAVKDLSLTIPHGSYCCLLGPSGCGKTTILRMIAGHEKPTSGDIRIGGQSVLGLPQMHIPAALGRPFRQHLGTDSGAPGHQFRALGH